MREESGQETRVRLCGGRVGQIAQRESERERTQRRKPNAPRGRCSGDRTARSHCLRFHASLAKPPQTARGVDPQAVSVPDTTPAATLTFAWKSDAMARATRAGAQSAGATASASVTFGKREGEARGRKRELRKRED